MGITCKVLGCVSGPARDRRNSTSLRKRQVKLFSVPKDSMLLSQWSSVLNIDLFENDYICEYHFQERDIIKEVRHNFPDGTYQVIPRGRWTLLSNAIPISREPKRYGEKISENLDNQQNIPAMQLADSVVTVVEDQTDQRQPFQQICNRPRAPRRLSHSLGDENSVELPSKKRKRHECINEDLQQLPKSLQCISDFSKSERALTPTDHRIDHGRETNIVAAQNESRSPLNSDEIIKFAWS